MPERVELPTYEMLLTEAIRSLTVDCGMATTPAAVGTNVLQDNTKAWPTDIHKNRLVKVIRSTGICQIRMIQGNTDNVLLVSGTWAQAIPVGVVYVIIPMDTARLIPIAKAAIFNTALPAADNDLLGANIIPTNSPSWLRIYITIAVAGRLYLRRTVGGATVSEDLNSGVNLTANAAHCFGPIEWRTGDSLNLRYSATGGNILILRIDEIGAAE